ncbi:MAG: MBL fold metallo-hydrolase [Salinivirgaceae bacterium]|nr:MBL fold metallo-hydrolase [Salinivirgaceae bacterium]
MNQWKLQNGTIIYQLLKGRSNVYFINTVNTNILVDTGKTNKKNELLKAIEWLDSRPDYLILTHTHFDHCQNAKFLHEKFNCKIIASKAESDFTKNGFTPIPKGTNTLTKAISKLGSKSTSKNYKYAPFATELLIDSDNIHLHLIADIELIETPGHSKGSISILINNEIAIVGDTLFGIFANTIFPPYADDVKLLIRSWEKLLDTKCNLFLPGHGKPITRDMLEHCYLIKTK